ncbi:MAG: hypothetical protein ACJ79R_22185, partial [Anaeromyxobacteraceae bacterium]
SQVVLGVPPLTGTMGHSECEHAAAIIVRVCQVRGDRWQPVSPAMLGEVINTDLDAKAEPFHSLNRNPFFRPDFCELVEKGFARWCGTDGEKGLPIELTEAGIAALRRWVIPANTESPPPKVRI